MVRYIKHVIYDLYCCGKLEFNKSVVEHATGLAKCGETVLYCENEFVKNIKSAMILCQHGHINISAYFETSLVSLDIYCDGKQTDPYNAILFLRDYFNPAFWKEWDLNRGRKIEKNFKLWK